MAATNSLRALALVGGVATAAALLVTGSYEFSKDRIAANQRERLLQSLHQVLDPQAHDNDLTATRFTVNDPELLGSEEPVDVFIATRQGAPVAVLLTPVAPDGYNAPIRLLIGISVDRTITGVRVLSHRETPGLGDWIDISKSDWITQFVGASLEDPMPEAWTIRQEGGRFDSFTGATVTPRAVIGAVKNALLYFERHRTELFAAATRDAHAVDIPENE